MSLLTDASDRFKADLLADDMTARRRIVNAYGEAYGRLAPEVERVARKIERAREAGEAPSTAWLYRVGRLSQLQEQAAREMSAFGGQAEDLITRAQRQTAERGGQEAEELTRVSLAEGGIGTRVDWNRVPKEALKDLVGNLSDGSPLSDLFNQYGPDAATGLKDTLTSGLVAGWNPRRIASAFREQMAGNLNRAMVVARTETLRVYRESTRRSFINNSDVVQGWVWLATLTTRTCPCCWAMNGTMHGNEETLDGHPSCRCCMVPHTKSAKELGLGDNETSVADSIPLGESVFANLSEADQYTILGPRGFQLYNSGQVHLSDFVGRKENRAWGSMRYVLSPGQALAKAATEASGPSLAALDPEAARVRANLASKVSNLRKKLRNEGFGTADEIEAEVRRLVPDYFKEGGPAPGIVGPGPIGPKPVIEPAPLTFENRKAIKEWGQENFKAWAESLTAEEAKAFETYKSIRYEEINAALRSSQPLTGDMKKIVELIDASLAKVEMPEAVTVLRGDFNPQLLEALKDGKAIGQVFGDSAFMSTTLHEGTVGMYASTEGVVLELVVPKGARAAFIDALPSTTQGELEVLLPRGTNYRVTGVRVDENGIRRVQAELVAQPVVPVVPVVPIVPVIEPVGLSAETITELQDVFAYGEKHKAEKLIVRNLDTGQTLIGDVSEGNTTIGLSRAQKQELEGFSRTSVVHNHPLLPGETEFRTFSSEDLSQFADTAGFREGHIVGVDRTVHSIVIPEGVTLDFRLARQIQSEFGGVHVDLLDEAGWGKAEATKVARYNEAMRRAVEKHGLEFRITSLPGEVPPPPPVVKPVVATGRDELTAKHFNGKVKVVHEGMAGAEKTAIDLLGKMPTDEEWGRLVGAMDGANIRVVHLKLGDKSSFNIVVEHPLFEKDSVRSIQRQYSGKVTMTMDNLHLKPDAPKGLGTRIFAHTVDEAPKFGIKGLGTIAADGNGFNGYYTWPRLGYNMEFKELQIEAARKAGFGEVVDTHGLFSKKGGAEWWKANGIGGKARFDLAEDSMSRKVFGDYLEARGVRVGQLVTPPVIPPPPVVPPKFVLDLDKALAKEWADGTSDGRLELVKRLLGEGRTTDEIAIIVGRMPKQIVDVADLIKPLPPPPVVLPPPVLPPPIPQPGPGPFPGVTDPKEIARLKANAASRVSKMRKKLLAEGKTAEEAEAIVRKLVPEHFGGTGVIKPDPIPLPPPPKPGPPPPKPVPVPKPEVVVPPKPAKPPLEIPKVGGRAPKSLRGYPQDYVMEHVEKALADGYSVEEIAKTFGLPKVQVELIRDVTARRAAASEARKAAMPKPTMTAKDARTRLTAFDPNLADDLKRAERELKEKQEQVNQAFEQHRTTKPGTLQYDVTKKKLEDMMQRRSIFQREFQRLEKELRSGSADAIAAIFPDKGEANVIIDYSGLLGSKNKPNGQPMLPSASQRAGVDAAKQGLQKFTKLIGPGRIDGKTVKFSVTPDGREFYRASNNTVALKKAGSQLKTVVHEMGHWLEEHEPETYKTAKAFLEKRTQGEIAQPMSKLTGNKNYDIQEVAKPDKFPDAYVGKVYHGATEVVSMGLEYMVTDPMKFAKTDPEYFDLIYDIINGVHL